MLFVCVALNASLIGCYLLRPLLAGLHQLHHGFVRSWRYLHGSTSEIREKAFRRRTFLLVQNLALVIGQLLLVALFYSPSLVLAHYQSHWPDAVMSFEALAGMALAALVCGWRLSRS